MERDRLVQLLDVPGDAIGACRAALLDGAELTSWDDAMPAARILSTYERRLAQSIARGTATKGFAESLRCLRDAGAQPVSLCQITATQPPYVYMVILSGEPTAVIACFGVSQVAAS